MISVYDRVENITGNGKKFSFSSNVFKRPLSQDYLKSGLYVKESMSIHSTRTDGTELSKDFTIQMMAWLVLHVLQFLFFFKALSHTTNFRLFQFERVCRRQFEI